MALTSGANRVFETTTTSGNVAYAFGGIYSGFGGQAFASGLSGQFVSVTAVDGSGLFWEQFKGIVSGANISRPYIEASCSGGSALTWPNNAAKAIYLTPHASDYAKINASGSMLSIGSGAVTATELGSGSVRSGHINVGGTPNGTNFLRDDYTWAGASVASGQVQRFQLGSGAVNSGHISSGAVIGSLGGGAFTIASGTIGPNDVGSGAIKSGAIASGQIGQFHLSSGSVTSGAISSGVVGQFHLSSGSVSSGAISSGVVGQFHLSSGAVNSGAISSGVIGLNHIASGAVRSGHIASGQIGNNHIAQAAVLSGNIAGAAVGDGHIANNAVRSGHIASGQLCGYHIASGYIPQNAGPFVSGSAWTITTEETVSGLRAVQISQSGRLRIAMATVSGRMPAVGVVVDNVASGIQANVFTDCVLQAGAGNADYSGYLGRPLFVGRSGQVVTTSGSFNSGGLLSGDIWHQIGYALNSGGAVISMASQPLFTMVSG